MVPAPAVPLCWAEGWFEGGDWIGFLSSLAPPPHHILEEGVDLKMLSIDI